MKLRPPAALATVHPKARLCCFMFLPLFLGGGGVCVLPLFCYALLNVLSRLTCVLARKRELVTVLKLSVKCLVTVSVF